MMKRHLTVNFVSFQSCGINVQRKAGKFSCQNSADSWHCKWIQFPSRTELPYQSSTYKSNCPLLLCNMMEVFALENSPSPAIRTFTVPPLIWDKGNTVSSPCVLMCVCLFISAFLGHSSETERGGGLNRDEDFFQNISFGIF